MNKLQSFYVLKFSSSRLKECNYNVTINLSEAKENGEVIRLGDSEVLSIIRRITGKRFDPVEFESLELERNRIKKKPNSKDNRNKLDKIENKIDILLYIPQIVSVKFDNVTHYEKMIKSGFFVNGKSFVRLLSGAGNLRRNTVFFVDSAIEPQVRKVMNNGRNDVELNAAKYAAYAGLYGSAGLSVSFPNFAVVEDYEATRNELVNNIDSQSLEVTQRETDIKLNLFDGQGLISPRLANTWAWEMGLDYVPSTFIFRAPFSKGQIVTFDFHKLASMNGVSHITDIWGNSVDVAGVDLLISKSQFKMHMGYSSAQHYIDSCQKNFLGFRITRVSHQYPKSSTTSNYMFLQVLDLTDEDIEKLTKDTREYFSSLMGKDLNKMLLYLGKGVFSSRDGLPNKWFDRLDVMAQALILQPELRNDPYIIDSFSRSLNRQIQDSYLGKLILEGNFSPLVSDPYYQASLILGLNNNGLLSDGEHYSHFWNERNVPVVAGGRSPLTHHSEMMVMKLADREELREWYKYQNSSFIIPPDSLDTTRMADADFDGDLIFSTSSPEFIKGKIDGLPIVYSKRVASKSYVNEDDLWMVDSDGFDSKVGLVTNVSSTFHCMKSDYSPDFIEFDELEKRLVLLRMYQGEAIDSAKNGGVSLTMPEKWLKWQPRDEFKDDKSWRFSNSLTGDRRPAFCRWLYRDYKVRYNSEISIFDLESKAKFGIPFEELLKLFHVSLNEITKEELELVVRYLRHSFFIHNNSTMNRISEYMVNSVSEIRKHSKRSRFDHRILLSKDFSGVDKTKLSKLQALLKEYNGMKHSMRHGESDKYKSLESIISQIRRKAFLTISSNETELTDLTIILTYGVLQNSTKAFAWNVFGDGIVKNLLEKSDGIVTVPLIKTGGEIEYLYETYSLTEVNLNAEDIE